MAGRKRKLKTKKFTQNQLQVLIFRFFTKNPKVRLNATQLQQKLKLSNSKDSINAALDALERRNKLNFLKDAKYSLGPKRERNKDKYRKLKVTGIVDMTRSGSAYIVSDELQDDAYVSAKNLQGAFHQDTVLVEITISRNMRKPSGKVIKVLERANTVFMGTLQLFPHYGIVYINHPKMMLDIMVRSDDLLDAEDGNVVLVRIYDFGKGQNKQLLGKIIEVIDTTNRDDLEMNSILINNGFNIKFPDEVLSQVENIPEKMENQEISKRKDFRGIACFTIDPADAKDFDDALSVDQLDEDFIQIGVHIADVSHYVTEDSPLDFEAYKRSTSVYLVDRVCPMLPEKLSNHLCSLKPNEDRYTFSVEFKFDKNFNLVSHWIGKSIIHSNNRFTYEEAQQAIESKKGPFSPELYLLNEIAKNLRKKRFSGGSINFDSDEVRFELDADGFPKGISVKERKESHLLVEEFMLLANKTVAKFISQDKKSNAIPFIYRVHDLPNQEKLAEFALFAAELGVTMKIDSPKNISQSLNKISISVAENEALKLLMPLAIRTMAKAEYSANNIGHFGLAFKDYTHFTSPIRRYSDLVAHRIIEKNLKKVFKPKLHELAKKCQHISKKERSAMAAERESIKYKQTEYLSQFIGKQFDALVSGMNDRGIFVELKESRAEGMINFDKFQDYFRLGAGNLKAIGQKSGQIIKMGDSLKVKLINTDLGNRKAEFELISF